MYFFFALALYFVHEERKTQKKSSDQARSISTWCVYPAWWVDTNTCSSTGLVIGWLAAGVQGYFLTQSHLTLISAFHCTQQHNLLYKAISHKWSHMNLNFVFRNKFSACPKLLWPHTLSSTCTVVLLYIDDNMYDIWNVRKLQAVPQLLLEKL